MSKIYDFLGAVGKIGFEQLSQRNLPKTVGKVQLKGLRAEVEIIRDEWGIPHIYAQNLHDLFFAQGYVQAQDRFWQMELQRRVATGTVAEILGESALDLDIASRTFGFARLGQQDATTLSEPVLHAVLAHIAGINAYLKKNIDNLPVEFTISQHTPKLWTLNDTLAFMRLMAWQLSHAWQGELIRARFAEIVGEQAASELDIAYTPDNPAIVPNSIWRGADHPSLRQNNGSNSWAISPQKSTTGGALLANDPHLALSAPSVWYENHLYAPNFHLTGVTIPAVPLVLIGHNEHIGWGITLAFTDCEDLFVETFESLYSTRYRHQNQWRQAEISEEQIVVKGKPAPHIERVISTVHGVIISETLPEHYDNNELSVRKIALQSVALMPANLLDSWYNLNVARDWDDFSAAIALMDAPQLNFTYVDIQGNIGYRVSGKVPIRKKGNGKLPAEGSSGEYDWVGFVPTNEMPYTFNPDTGYVVTANNKVVDEDYPYFLGDVWMNGFRARRIVDMIHAKNTISPEDCRLMQNDLLCLPGLAFAAHFRTLYKNIPAGTPLKKALFRLISWDGFLTLDSVGGCIYHAFRYQMLTIVLGKTLEDPLLRSFLGEGFHSALNRTNEFQAHDIVVLLRWLSQPEGSSFWVEQAGGKAALLRQSAEQGVLWLQQTLGDDMRHWRWGRLRRAVFSHAFGVRQPFDRVFNVGYYPTGGDADTVCQTHDVGGDMPNNRVVGASFRMVLSAKNWENSYAVLPPGQSGHIGSPHYKDQITLWLKGELRPLLWSREQVEVYACETLRLKPLRRGSKDKL